MAVPLRRCGRVLGPVSNLRMGVRACSHITEGVPYKKKIKDETVSSSSPGCSVPEYADVVVVGGGSLGCNILYHLAKLGATNTVLLESHRLTAGTTWHTAGLLWRLRPSDTEIALIDTTRQMLCRLEDETGINPGWINNGGLFIASSKERLKEYQRLQTVGRVNGVESYVLGPEETQKLYPLMNVKDIVGTLYCPGDGTMDPAGVCQGLTRWATRAGAKVIEECPVTDIKTTETLLGGRKVTEVHTSRGVIKTNAVVNATGCWANDLAQLVGVEVPLTPMKHAYVVTEKIPGIETMPNVRDHDASVYLRLQGDALSVGGYEVNPIFLDRLDKDFAFGLYELDWDVFGAHIEGAINRIPTLERTGIKSTVCGPESFTPDHKPVMGEDPQVEGFFHCVGFNSSGMMLGGGCGDQMARWVLHGRPDLDMFGYDIRRYHPPLNSNKAWVAARSHESYAKNYSIVFPHDEPLAGRGQRRSPIHQELQDAGCVFQERHGWERPGWFTSAPTPTLPYDWYGAYETTPPHPDDPYKALLNDDYSFDFPAHHHQIQQECLTCRERVAIFDMSYFGKYFLTGPDAQQAADWIFSANMARQPGATIYTCMLNARGGVEADLTVSVCEGGSGSPCDPAFEGRGFYLAAGGAAALQNLAHVMKEVRQKGWRVSLLDHTDNMALLSVQGRHSRAILQGLTPDDLGDDTFPFSSHKVITLAGHTVRALRVSFVGELGWELHVPNESALAVYQAVMVAGRPWGITNAGYRAIDSLSCEKGYRHWHGDVRPDDTPLEAGLAFTCKLKTDTDFLGRAAVERQRAEGVTRKLVTLTLQDGTQPLWGLEAIVRDGQIVGYARRAEYAFALGRAIAYGYVRRPDGGPVNKEFLSSGSWHLESMGESFPATLHTRPPFDPKNLRLKGVYDDDVTETERSSMARAGQ